MLCRGTHGSKGPGKDFLWGSGVAMTNGKLPANRERPSSYFFNKAPMGFHPIPNFLGANWPIPVHWLLSSCRAWIPEGVSDKEE